MKGLNMKKLLLSTIALTALVAPSLRAGTETYKQVAPPPPPPHYGDGFYGAIDMGANVLQNSGVDKTFSANEPKVSAEDSGVTTTDSSMNDVRFSCPMKLV